MGLLGLVIIVKVNGPSGRQNREVHKMSTPFLSLMMASRPAFFASLSPCVFIVILANTSFRKAHAIDTNYEIVHYSKPTSTTVLHKHLCDCHVNTWISSCTELNINITAKAAQSTVNAYWRKYEGFSQPTEGNGAEHICQTYSQEAFLDALVDFIVSDDQVWTFAAIASIS